MKRVAFIRCRNEESTIIACLMSIENIFTDIVIIHSDITDTSLDLIEEYSRGRSNIIIEKYPHHVYPALHDIYQKDDYHVQNSLANYYNFGWDICRKVGGSICKIDCDQVYIQESLFNQFEEQERQLLLNPSQSYLSGLWGINSFVYNNTIFIVGNKRVNGLGDHFIVSDNTCLKYHQTAYYEIPKYLKETITLPYNTLAAWFHFRDKIQRIHNGEKQEFSPESFSKNRNGVLYFDEDLIELFEEKVRPLLIQSKSPYKDIVFD